MQERIGGIQHIARCEHCCDCQFLAHRERPRDGRRMWFGGVLRHELTTSDGLDVTRLLGEWERHWLYVGDDAVWRLADEARDGAHERVGRRDCDRQTIARKVRRMGRTRWDRTGVQSLCVAEGVREKRALEMCCRDRQGRLLRSGIGWEGRRGVHGPSARVLLTAQRKTVTTLGYILKYLHTCNAAHHDNGGSQCLFKHHQRPGDSE